MTNLQHQYLSDLQLRIINLKRQVKAFESGSKYRSMKADIDRLIGKLETQRVKFSSELSNVHAETVTVRNNWLQVVEDMEKAHKKELAAKDREIDHLKKALYEEQNKKTEVKEQLAVKRKEFYEVSTLLEEERGKNQKLQAQINRDYENSSKPSSMSENKKKIQNNRQKTGRKPGAQAGHKGHGRKQQEPTEKILLPAPQMTRL